MKTLFTRMFLITTLALTGTFAVAQDEGGPPPDISPSRLQEIKAQKTAFLTRQMDLTPVEAQKFWPVYDQYDKELETARKDMRETFRSMKRDKELTEAEASQAIDKVSANAQQELDIRKHYAAEFKKVLGSVKTLKLFRAEKDFNRELLKRMHDGNGGPGRGGPTPGGGR